MLPGNLPSPEKAALPRNLLKAYGKAFKNTLIANNSSASPDFPPRGTGGGTGLEWGRDREGEGSLATAALCESPVGAQPKHWPKWAKTWSSASIWVPQRPTWAWVAGRSYESLEQVPGEGSGSPGSLLQMGPEEDLQGTLSALSWLGLDPRCWPSSLPWSLLWLGRVSQAPVACINMGARVRCLTDLFPSSYL